MGWRTLALVRQVVPASSSAACTSVESTRARRRARHAASVPSTRPTATSVAPAASASVFKSTWTKTVPKLRWWVGWWRWIADTSTTRQHYRRTPPGSVYTIGCRHAPCAKKLRMMMSVGFRSGHVRKVDLYNVVLLLKICRNCTWYYRNMTRAWTRAY